MEGGFVVAKEDGYGYLAAYPAAMVRRRLSKRCRSRWLRRASRVPGSTATLLTWPVFVPLSMCERAPSYTNACSNVTILDSKSMCLHSRPSASPRRQPVAKRSLQSAAKRSPDVEPRNSRTSSTDQAVPFFRLSRLTRMIPRATFLSRRPSSIASLSAFESALTAFRAVPGARPWSICRRAAQAFTAVRESLLSLTCPSSGRM